MLANAVPIRQQTLALVAQRPLLLGQLALRLLKIALLGRQFLFENALAITVARLLRIVLYLGETGRRWRRRCTGAGLRYRPWEPAPPSSFPN